MKKKILSLIAAISISVMAGCTEIPDKKMPHEVTGEAAAATAESTAEEEHFTEIPAKKYEFEVKEFSAHLNAEGGIFKGNVRTDGKYDGSGYIVLDEGQSFSHITSPESSQHYRISIAAHSYEGAAIRLKVLNETAGVYYIPASMSEDFELYTIDNIYLSSGPNIIAFEVTNGSVAVDYIDVVNSSRTSQSAYYVSSACVSSGTSVSAIALMKYLRDTYGKMTITGQCVTPGTNAEIEAVTKETGRSPAIRTGDMMYFTPSVYAENKQTAEDELALAIEWSKNGGIVSMGWHWFAPIGKKDFYAQTTDFVPAEAVTEHDISMSGYDELQALVEAGIITDSTLALMKDIDAVASALAVFRDEGIPVIFQPLPDGDSGKYWWSGSPETYKWLWNLVFNRLDRYYSLNNLIWLWNGSNPDYFPGRDMCDIIGQGFFEGSSASFAGRFSVISSVSKDIPKMLAITSCDHLPNPDYMHRDNAMWLWFSIASGSAIIDNKGNLSEIHTSWQALHDAYNNELCVTLDELPNLKEYSLIG